MSEMRTILTFLQVGEKRVGGGKQLFPSPHVHDMHDSTIARADFSYITHARAFILVIRTEIYVCISHESVRSELPCLKIRNTKI